MNRATFRVLVVDDYEPWRRTVSATLLKKPELQVAGEATDGLEAVQKAKELQPDLILMDIGLPNLNGIEAARRIFRSVPDTKILFVSEERSAEIADEALRTGGCAYVIKSHATSELLPAIEAALQGKRFVSTTLPSLDCNVPFNDHSAAIKHCHEVSFFADDAAVVDRYARFIASALNSGSVVISVTTEAHQISVVQRLATDGVDLAAAIEQGRYIPVDAADTLSRLLTVNDMPDPVRCAKVIDDLLTRAIEGAKRNNVRVVFCGEVAPTLLSRGNAEGAIQLEHMWDEITRKQGVDTLCGYLWSLLPGRENNPFFQRICAEHSAVREL
jgi:CheY-like chemotaxis protein